MLDVLSPQWKKAHLEQPFRWQANDPLEKFSFDVLLLNAEIADLGTISNQNDVISHCHSERVHQDKLLENESLLREIFGLLLSAHYQTKPSDLVRLLDDNHYQIFIMRYKTHLVATALIAQEGGFSEALAEAIYNGNRRPQGHLIPQLLATHVGIKEAPCYEGDRIMRIAVHPTLQGRGLGSHFLQYLINYSKQQNKADYIGTSFGATPQLIAFWRNANFKTVQVGMKRDASSGTHSIIMLRPFSQSAQHLVEKATDNFSRAFPLLLADPLRDLEASLVVALYAPSIQKNKPTQLILEEAKWYALTGFAYQQRGYESSIAVINEVTQYALTQCGQANTLSAKEWQVLIAKVLQKQSWQVVGQLTQVKGKKSVIKLLRQAVKKLVYQYLKR
jgi:tRNA(Met) cytidine acetyltransferase